MSNQPWGPHGREAPPNTVTPNPTPADPVPTLGQPADAPLPTGGGGALSIIIINFIVAFFIVAILWIPMVCLYPLTGTATIATWLVTKPILTGVLPAEAGDVPAALAYLIAAVVAGVMIRVESRLAQSMGYRLPRHVVRMVLLAIWSIPIIQLTMGAEAPTSSTAYIFAVVTQPGAMLQFLMSPLNFGIWVAVVVGLHFLIWKAEGVRRFWHRRLVWIGLK
jgi:hypothetical protein